jgi:hypothetical protein
MPYQIYLMRIGFGVRGLAELWYEQLDDLLFIASYFGEIECGELFCGSTR